MTLTKTPAKRPTVHHKKRTGQHHRQNRHYLKAYWPYLPVFAVLIAGMIAAHILAPHHGGAVLGAQTDRYQTLLTETNSDRQAAQLPILQQNSTLQAAAQAKANDMVARNYWSHTSPDGTQPWQFITKAGYSYQTAGENLAYGFASGDEVDDAWMHSAEHKANILNASYGQVGYATAYSSDFRGQGPATIVVAMYASPAVSAAPIKTADIGNASQTVSRVQAASGQVWLNYVVVGVIGASLIIFFVRHARAWHKVLVRSEEFALHHPFFDVLLIGVAVLGFLLSPAAGVIL